MEDLIKLAVLLLTIFFYLYRALKKNQDEDVFPIPGLPEEVRQKTRQNRSPEPQWKEISDKITLLEKNQKVQPIPHSLESIANYINDTKDTKEKESEPISILNALEEEYSAEQRMIIYHEIIKRPEF